ncbi:MAG: hypothetical protein ACJ789_02470 [Thermomicrobiales bacterium]
MHSRSIPRLLLVSLMFAFIAAGALHVKTAASQVAVQEWTTTQSQEDVPVQSCGGSDITTNYTITRDYVRYNIPNVDPVFERQQVSFTGSIGNATSGKSYEYDGRFSQAIDFKRGAVSITDLILRFEVGTPDQFSVSLDKVGFDLADNPPAVVQAFVPFALHTDLCDLLGGPAEDVVPAPGLGMTIHTENSALPQPVILPANYPLEDDMISDPSQALQSAEVEPAAADTMTNWSELDPCDTSPPGQPC